MRDSSPKNETFVIIYSRTKKFIQFWNYLRVSKWWQNCHFWVNYPFKSILITAAIIDFLYLLKPTAVLIRVLADINHLLALRVWFSHWKCKGLCSHTKSRFSLYVCVGTNKVLDGFRQKKIGLDEGEEGIDFLQVILNGGACQQDSETHCKLRRQMSVNSRVRLKNWQARLDLLSGVYRLTVTVKTMKMQSCNLFEGLVQQWFLVLQPVSLIDN